jgi:hypothetical protein
MIDECDEILRVMFVSCAPLASWRAQQLAMERQARLHARQPRFARTNRLPPIRVQWPEVHSCSCGLPLAYSGAYRIGCKRTVTRYEWRNGCCSSEIGTRCQAGDSEPMSVFDLCW